MQAHPDLAFPDDLTKALLLGLALCHCDGNNGRHGAASADGAGGGSNSTGGGGGTGGSGGGGDASSGGEASGTGGEAGASDPAWLAAPEGSPPELLSEVGLYPDLADLGAHHERATLYRPGHALWTNGSSKQRFVVLPEAESVDTSERQAWQFPVGTLFFKTFSYPDAGESDGLRPVETRMIRRTEDGYEYHAYLWEADRSDAELLDGIRPVQVEVEFEGDSFEHTVPARLDCRKCHESQPVNIIGFDELRLNSKLSSSDAETQLEALFEQGLLSDGVSDPASIENEDSVTEQVLGYLHGNCAHCHNGWDGPSSAFDMRYPVALENLIEQETTSELVSGIRVVPGEPDESALLAAMRRDEVDMAQPMPPLGVDRRDDAALSLIEGWIADLEPSGEGGAPGE